LRKYAEPTDPGLRGIPPTRRSGSVSDRPADELYGARSMGEVLRLRTTADTTLRVRRTSVRPSSRPCPAEPGSAESWRPECSVGVTSAAMASRFGLETLADAYVEFHRRHMGATLTNEEPVEALMAHTEYGLTDETLRAPHHRAGRRKVPPGCDRDGRVAVRDGSEHRARWSGSRPSESANRRNCVLITIRALTSTARPLRSEPPESPPSF
jgi:hypothetical protein